MKIEREETEFQPVVITLESQMEVDALTDALCIVANLTSHSNEGTGFIDHLAELLNDKFTSDPHDTVYYDRSWQDLGELLHAK